MGGLCYSGEIGQALKIAKGYPFIGTALCYLTTESVYFIFQCRLRCRLRYSTKFIPVYRRCTALGLLL